MGPEELGGEIGLLLEEGCVENYVVFGGERRGEKESG